MNLSRLTLWGVATVIYLAVLAIRPGTPIAGAMSLSVFIVWPLLAAAACLGTRRRVAPASQRGWALFGAACITWSAGSGLWSVGTPLLGVAADLLYVVYCLLCIAAATSFPLPQQRLRTRRLVRLDVVVVALTVGITYWTWVVPVYNAARTHGSLLGATWMAVNAVFLAVVLVRATRGQAGRRVVWALTVGATLALTGADAIYQLQLIDLSYRIGQPLDGLWAVGFVTLGAAALHRRTYPAARSMVGSATTLGGDIVVYGATCAAGLTLIWRGAADGLTPFILISAVLLVAASTLRHIAIAADYADLTRRLQDTTQELGETLASYQTALRVGRVAAWEWRAADDRVRWSPHSEQILGAAPAAFPEWLAMVHPDDRAMARARVVGALRGAQPYDMELRIVRPDGAILWIAATATVERGDDGRATAMVGNIIDITPRKVSELELQETTALLEHVMTASPIHIFAGTVVAGRYEPSYVSENISRLLGGRVDDYRNGDRAWDRLVHPDDLELAVASNRRAIAEGHSEHEVRMRHADGRYLWFRTVLRVTPSDGAGPQGYVGCIIDVTAYRHTEQQLRQAQKMEAVGQLAGGIAHDFNNLLTAVSGYAEQAQTHTGAGTPAHAALREVLVATSQAATLVDQLLTFSRRQEVRACDLDVRAAVAGMAGILRTSLGDAIDLRILTGATCGSVRLPAGQLEQLLLNLTVNARDAMPRGGSLTITACDVRLEPATAGHHGLAAGPYVAIDVSDSGEGMSQETLAHAFEPFFTTKPVGSGTGLGLATVYGIVTQAGGAVTIDSIPGGGTTASVLLPAVEAVPAPSAEPPAPGRVEHGRRATVLLVEDQPQVRALVTAALEREGHRVVAAGDGLEALERLSACQAPPDLLLTDVVMPGMNGVDLAEQVTAARPDVPVIFMSGFADIPAPQLTGGHTFLRKPFSIAELRATVAAALSSEAGVPVTS